MEVSDDDDNDCQTKTSGKKKHVTIEG